jgi:cytochrome c-type biogenesis protein CcmF
MTAELGQLALVLALWAALAQVALPWWGVRRGDARLMDVAPWAALAQFIFVAAAFGLLIACFVQNDFSVALVGQHSNSRLPLEYRITATWGNHEGSILLWGLVMALWTVAVAVFSRQLDRAMLARVLVVLGAVSAGFLGFTLLTSNPFERHFPALADGQDLNPMLQDPGMIAHPPLLYMGYVGFVVAYAFTVATLWSGRLDTAWARWSRPWTLVAWAFLTLGIAVGSFWAYYELGWGGWWFWDPVENASFVPWLLGTALVHSLAVTEARQGFRAWTALLAIGAFSFALLGTFIVRSGVLSSVHAFASDPTRGIYILLFLACVAGGALLLFALRAGELRQPGEAAQFDWSSREATLLLNNVLLTVAAISVALGTLYPLALDALGLGKVSVGPPYFETIFPPLMAPAMLLMVVGPLARWRRTEVPTLARQLRWAAVVSVLVAVLGPWIAGSGSWLTAFGLLLATWVALGTLVALGQRLGPRRVWMQRLRTLPGSFWGMFLAHLGIAMFIAGVTVVNSYEIAKDVRMEPGQTVAVGDYTLEFIGVRPLNGPNYEGQRGELRLLKGDRVMRDMAPERRVYLASGMPMTEVALDRGFTRDVYVALGDPLGGGAWSVRAQLKPLVNWIWLGCLLMAFGGFCAAADRRYRVVVRRRQAAAAAKLAGAAAR